MWSCANTFWGFLVSKRALNTCRRCNEESTGSQVPECHSFARMNHSKPFIIVLGYTRGKDFLKGNLKHLKVQNSFLYGNITTVIHGHIGWKEVIFPFPGWNREEKKRWKQKKIRSFLINQKRVFDGWKCPCFLVPEQDKLPKNMLHVCSVSDPFKGYCSQI